MSLYIVTITSLANLDYFEWSFNNWQDALAFAKASENIVKPPRAAIYEIRETERGPRQFETNYESPVEIAYQMARVEAHRNGT